MPRIGITSLKLLAVALLMVATGACSVEKFAVDQLGNAMAGSGGAYARDNDPALVREAIPFGLKTAESMLDVSPEHRGLLLTAASGYTGYAFFLGDEADRIEAKDLTRARRLRARASNLYLRARDYALRGLEVAHPGFSAGLQEDPAAAVARTSGEDVPFLYWAGAAWAAALGADTDNVDLIADLPLPGVLMQRVIDLDESYDRGAAHEFLISYEAARPGGSVDAARAHYRRALALSRGERASVHVALAEAVAVPEQDLAAFQRSIDAALAVDPDAVPDLRLANTIAHQRARWLRARIPDLFVDAETTGPQS